MISNSHCSVQAFSDVLLARLQNLTTQAEVSESVA